MLQKGLGRLIDINDRSRSHASVVHFGAGDCGDSGGAAKLNAPVAAFNGAMTVVAPYATVELRDEQQSIIAFTKVTLHHSGPGQLCYRDRNKSCPRSLLRSPHQHGSSPTRFRPIWLRCRILQAGGTPCGVLRPYPP